MKHVTKIKLQFIPLPVEIVDHGLDLTVHEFRVLTYLVRHQFKLGVPRICVSYDELGYGLKRRDGTRIDNGCGTKHTRDLKKAISELTKRGFLECRQPSNGTSPAGYSVTFLDFAEDEAAGSVEPPTRDDGTLQPGDTKGIQVGGQGLQFGDTRVSNLETVESPSWNPLMGGGLQFGDTRVSNLETLGSPIWIPLIRKRENYIRENCKGNSLFEENSLCKENSLEKCKGDFASSEAKSNVFTLPDWIPRKPWDDFEAMRKKNRKPMTDRARELAVIQLEKLRREGNPPGEVLNQSVLCGYQGLFAVKANGNGSRRDAADRERPRSIEENTV
jgi:hypothetical protein